MSEGIGFFQSLTERFRRSRKGRVNSLRARRRRTLLCEALEERQLLAADLLQVDALTPTPSGFVVQFNQAIDTGVLNLYDAENQALGPADVTLQGASTGPVAGSLVVRDNQLRFVATGGPLAPDTYTVTLRSAADGIRDQALSQLLDGEFTGSFPSGNGTAGGDFVHTFSVSESAGLVIGVADFARGPSQPVNVPAARDGAAVEDGLNLRLSQAAGVTSILATIRYDPELLTVSAVRLGPDAPAGSQVEANLTVPGEARVAFFSLDPLSEDALDVISLVASVPQTAPYGAVQVLEISDLEVNAGALEARADEAIHVVAFPGDANKNGRYDVEDARLVARVGVELDSGFAADPPHLPLGEQFRILYPTIDPAVIGDVTGRDGLSPLDASDLLRQVLGLPVPNIPAVPDLQGPLAVGIFPTSIAENAAIGAAVGTFTTINPDPAATHTYSLVSGAGSTGNAAFTIEGNTLRTAVSLDRETQASYSIRVRTTDNQGRFFEQTFVITVSSVNEAPTAISLTTSTVPENSAIGTVVGQLTTADPDTGDTHTYTLVGGEGSGDNAAFTIVGNELRTAAELDFETQSSYTVRIRSTDQDGLFVEQVLQITVTDVNEAPSALALSNTSVADGQPAGTVVGQLTTTDPDQEDTHTYSLVSGEGADDNASFLIVGDQLQTAVDADAQTQSTYTVRIRSTDQEGLFTESVFVISVTDGENQAPVAVELSNTSVDENQPPGTVVGDFSTQDPDAEDTHTYSLVVGEGADDNAWFEIVGDQLQTTAMLDFEQQSSYTVRVRSTDAGGLFVEQIFQITVNDLNEAPVELELSSTSVLENEPIGTIVGLLSAVDPDAGDTHTFTLVAGEGGDDNAAFQIVDNQLQTAAVFDFETQASYTIRVRATDAEGLFTEQAFVISVLDAENEPPLDVQLSASTVAENEPAGTVVGTLSTTDPNPEDVHVYSLVPGEGADDNASFVIVGNELQTAVVLDFESQSSYTVRVRSTDEGGLSVEQIFVITVTDVNEEPTEIALSRNLIAEDEPVGALVGLLSTLDPDAGDSHTYSLVAGEGSDDNGAFTIQDNQLVTAEVFDLETQASYTIRVRSTDAGGLFTEQTFIIAVTPANQAPTDVLLSNDSVAENQPVGTLVGLLSTEDPDADDLHTYTLVAGEGDEDNASFAIVDNQLVTAEVFDFETKDSYTIRVRSTDWAGLFVESVLVIAILDVENEAPLALEVSNTSVAENEPAGTVVGQLSTTDPNAEDSHTYSLVAGEGDDDNALFEIVGDQLQTTAPLDFESQSSYTVRIRSTDEGGLFVEQIVLITVDDVNEEPTELSLSNDTIVEGQPVGTVIGVLSTVDPDTGDTHTYELVAGEGDDDNAAFMIVDDTLQAADVFDSATQSTYSIRVRTTDQDGLSLEQIFQITVTAAPENQAPTELTLSNDTIVEGQPVGTVIGVLSTVDPDTGDTHSYELVEGEGDDDNGAFMIVDDTLQAGDVFDAATQSTYSIRVRTTDQDGLSLEQIFQITVTAAPENQAPTELSLSNDTIVEGQPVGTVIGVLNTVDPDTGDTHSYELVEGEGDDDNAAFMIVDDTLQAGDVFDAATQSTYSIRVRTTDQDGLSLEQTFQITVTAAPENQAPTELSLSNDTIVEGQPVGTVIGVLNTVDPDTGDTHTYELVEGEGDDDNAAFMIVDDTLQAGDVFDAATQSTYSIRVRTTDQDGLSLEQTFQITVTAAAENQAPTELSLSNDTIVEGQPVGSVIGVLSTVDPDTGDTHTYELVEGEGDDDNGAFMIVDDTLQAGDVFDAATQSTYSIRVRTTDQDGLSLEQTFQITVTAAPENQAPTGVVLSNHQVFEDAPLGSLVGMLSAIDDEGDVHTFTLESGSGDNDNNSFVIVGNEVHTNAAFDAEAQSSYTIRVRATDQDGLFVEQILQIDILGVDEG